MRIRRVNERLKGIFKLSHSIKLYIPSTFDVNGKIDSRQYVSDTLALFSKWFGGATSYDAKGAWVSGSKGLVVEDITIVVSYATREQVKKHLEDVLRHANKIKTELKQEAVSLEYDNELYLV